MTTFDIAEVAMALELPCEAVQACIRCGVLPATDVGCRQLLAAGAIVAFVPQPRRDEVRARLDDIRCRRGGHHGQG